MGKNNSKYLIASLLFIDICAVAVLGLLLAVVIPAGQSPRTAKYFLGLHRHEWGDIHLYLSVLLLVLVVVHLWLNWTWIIQSTKRYFGTRWQKVLWSFPAAGILVLVVAWLAVKL